MKLHAYAFHLNLHVCHFIIFTVCVCIIIIQKRSNKKILTGQHCMNDLLGFAFFFFFSFAFPILYYSDYALYYHINAKIILGVRDQKKHFLLNIYLTLHSMSVNRRHSKKKKKESHQKKF